MEIKINGVGKDAETETNSNGGKQSKAPMAMHLIDAYVLENLLSKENVELYRVLLRICTFMQTNDDAYLYMALNCIESNKCNQIIRIAKVLQEGAEKYEPNNWRLIPQEEHINHALIHLMAALMGDTQDDHLDHALCRIHMALATRKSESFDYSRYIPKEIKE